MSLLVEMMKTDVCLSLEASWRPLPGLAPEATHFWRNPQSGFSLFAKGALCARGLLTSRCEVTQTPKVSKRKATLLSATLRCATGTLRCSVQPGSRSNSPAAQTIASPDPSGLPLLGAARRGVETKYQQPNSAERAVRVLLPDFDFFPQTRSGWAEERRAKRIRARACLSVASLHETPLGSSTASCPVAKRRGPRLRVAFSLVSFFWRSKRK